MCKKLIVLALSLCMISSAGAATVSWDFEGGNQHLFNYWSANYGWPAADDPTIAGDESLTGIGGAQGLPDFGVAWTVGPPNQFDGQTPAFEEGCHIVNGVLEYGPCNDPFGVFDVDPPSYVNSRGQSGYLNTYNLSQWGDNLHTAANDQMATSPAVLLGEGSVLTVWTHGGGSGTHAPEYEADPALAYTDGSSGIAVLSAEEDDLYALLASVHTQGQSTLTEYTLDLSEFAGKRVYIEVVDAFQGSWGWLAVDEIRITNAVSKNALILVGNAALTAGFDQAQNDRLLSLGYNVLVIEPGDIADGIVTIDDCNGFDLLIVSESILSDGANPLIGTTTPIMHNESHGWDNWSFTDAGPAGWQGGIEVNIVNDTHPIVVDANVSIGPMQFFDPRGEWTTELVSALAPGAVSIAELIPEGSTDVYAIIFAIEKGAELANGTPATARAVGFSLPGQAYIEPEVMTPEGWALWDASIAWLDPPPPVITVGPIDTMVATGDEGDILSINGIDVNDMILGTSTYGDPSVASRDASNADDFSLATLASADSQEYMQTLFDQAVTSIFIVEFRGDDSGYVQALDAMGDPIESMVEFGPDDFSDTGYNSIHSVYTRAMVIRSEIPIYGIQLITIPGAEWGLSIDPLCIAAVPAP